MFCVSARRFPFFCALASFAIYYASLPPLRLSYAIFLVPAFWSVLVDPRRVVYTKGETLPKTRGFWRRWGDRLERRLFCGEYRQYWTASLLFWLATTVWVSYPHPATILGWIALSCYLACYFPLFIASSRALSRLLRFPIWASAPIAWIAVEYARNHALGGFSFAGLSHAIYDSLYLVQIAEPFGEYGVGATITLVGVLTGQAFVRRPTTRTEQERKSVKRAPRSFVCALLILFMTFLYGKSRVEYLDGLEENAREHNVRPLRLALLQDGTSYRFPLSSEINRLVSDKYLSLAAQASENPQGFDAIIWPEGSFVREYLDFSDDFSELFEFFEKTNAQLPVDETTLERLKKKYPEFFALSEARQVETRRLLERARESMRRGRLNLATLSSNLRAAVVLGTETIRLDSAGVPSFYNSCVFVPYFGEDSNFKKDSAKERLLQTPTDAAQDFDEGSFRRYDKIALVMFGEYMPFVEYLPKSWNLKGLCAEFSLGRGREFSTFVLRAAEDGPLYALAPDVCFESSIPQFIKRQTRALNPDVLVNVSNSGWFRNGSQTDLHLAARVYRAIENRRAVVAATHGGFSSWIDASGRIRAKGKRRGSEVVEAEILPVKTKPRSLKTIAVGGKTREIDLAETISVSCATLAFAAFFLSCVLSVVRRIRKISRQRRAVLTVDRNVPTI